MHQHTIFTTKIIARSMEYEPVDLKNKAPQPVLIKQLCDYEESFFVPSYQRGYKWGEHEVKALLNDIANYDSHKDGDFYCLQPVVVRRDEANKVWRVIDGQQRLTTLFLILKSLNKSLNNKDRMFKLTYQRDTNLENYDYNQPEIKITNSESYHITYALSFISKWLTENNNKPLRTNLLEKTKVIWYQLDTDEKTEQECVDMEHEYFLNLNSGKISLTEAELIKALLIHKNAASCGNVLETQQAYMAEEWDRMERNLRQEDVWYFIGGPKTIPANAMDYMLELLWSALSQMDQKKYANTEYKIFVWAENIEKKSIWDYIQRIFRTIMRWYNDCEMHNLIGFFVSRKMQDGKISELLSRVINVDDEKIGLPTRTELIRELWQSALTDKNLVCKLESLGRNTSEIFQQTFHTYRYDKEKDKIFDLLLLANIIHSTPSKAPRKFDFQRFNTTNWNVEHITPNHPKSNFELKNKLQKVLDDYSKAVLEEDGERSSITQTLKVPKDVKRLHELLCKISYDQDENRDLNELRGLSEEEKTELSELKSKLIPTDDEDTMIMENMTLLSERCNKGIGNNYFFDKKIRLAKYQAEGEYIPQLTLNVFTKWHSTHDTPSLFWHEKDRLDYLSALDGCFLTKISTLPISTDKQI